jgi:hypothetical protein
MGRSCSRLVATSPFVKASRRSASAMSAGSTVSAGLAALVAGGVVLVSVASSPALLVPSVKESTRGELMRYSNQ